MYIYTLVQCTIFIYLYIYSNIYMDMYKWDAIMEYTYGMYITTNSIDGIFLKQWASPGIFSQDIVARIG